MRMSDRVPSIRRWCAAAATCVVLGATLSGQTGTDAAALSKLTTVLADLARASTTRSASVSRPLATGSLPKSAQDAIRTRRLRIDANGEVQVYVLVREVTDEIKNQLTANGATIEIADAPRRRIQARVPVSQLVALARLAAVDAVRLPTYARPRTGSIDSEGDAIMHADAARTDFGLDGTGVRVGVVSDGLKGVFATGCTTCADVANGPISKADLPTASGVRNASGVLTSSTGGIVGRSFQANGDLEGLPPASPVCGFAGAGAEGTALLEIVHDLAPGAKLSFANAATDLEFAQAVNFLAASNDVVLDDIGFFGEPYDGTSGVSSNTAAALNNPANPIRAYFTAVGNDADEHYLGAYTDSGVDGATISGITTPGHLHLFQRSADTTDVLGIGAQPFNLISLPQNGEVAIFLTWDDPFGGSGNNYDLYLVQQSSGRIVARSTDVQSGRQDPVEALDFVNTGGADRFRIVVQNVQNAAAAKTLNIFSFQPECAAAGPQVLAPPAHERHNFNTASRSVSAQGDAGGSPVSVISVGAVCSASANAAAQFPSNVPDQSCLDVSNATPEFFSSQGPTLDGRTKPDVAGIDGVSITGAGGFGTPFFGTSAAAPHMGALAALFLQGAPCLLNRAASTIDAATARAVVHDTILRHASAADQPSNNTLGVGLGDVLATAHSALPVPPSKTTLTLDGDTLFGTTLSASRLGFVDPNQCALTTLSWSGGCGTGPGSTMTCPVGANAVSVRASNNGVAFSDPVDFQINVTSFSVAASPASASVSAGQSARYLVTLAPQSGEFDTTITLGCSNLPAQSACAFSPPTVTLGASPVQSTLTISTVASTATPATGRRRPAVLALPALPASVPPLPSALWLAVAVALAAVGRLRGRIGDGVGTDGGQIGDGSGTDRGQMGDGSGTDRGQIRVRWGAQGAIVAGLVITPMLVGAMAPGIAVFPATVTFGSQTVGTVAPPAVVSVTNIGADPLTITSITPAGDFATTTTCSQTLAAGASCGIGVTFSPTAAGSRTGTLSIADSATGSPHTVALQGTGVAAPAATGATPAGNYSVTITGTAGSFVQTAAVVLTVQ